jgi:hypothetical protein
MPIVQLREKVVERLPMRPKRIVIALTFAICAAGLSSLTARADAIDGDWCAPDGRRLSILGPAIITPGGARITGNYSRHHFRYVAPKTEPGAGETVEMSLRSEEEVWVLPRHDAPVEAWYRCPNTV